MDDKALGPKPARRDRCQVHGPMLNRVELPAEGLAAVPELDHLPAVDVDRAAVLHVDDLIRLRAADGHAVGGPPVHELVALRRGGLSDASGQGVSNSRTPPPVEADSTFIAEITVEIGGFRESMPMDDKPVMCDRVRRQECGLPQSPTGVAFLGAPLVRPGGIGHEAFQCRGDRPVGDGGGRRRHRSDGGCAERLGGQPATVRQGGAARGGGLDQPAGAGHYATGRAISGPLGQSHGARTRAPRSGGGAHHPRPQASPTIGPRSSNGQRQGHRRLRVLGRVADQAGSELIGTGPAPRG
ncbi:hypothetical protein Ddc_22397 [Ditylenchus destructor]|nr:hypothetical protein Ddc_22397 [Ditylenchus destructor]